MQAVILFPSSIKAFVSGRTYCMHDSNNFTFWNSEDHTHMYRESPQTFKQRNLLACSCSTKVTEKRNILVRDMPREPVIMNYVSTVRGRRDPPISVNISLVTYQRIIYVFQMLLMSKEYFYCMPYPSSLMAKHAKTLAQDYASCSSVAATI